MAERDPLDRRWIVGDDDPQLALVRAYDVDWPARYLGSGGRAARQAHPRDDALRVGVDLDKLVGRVGDGVDVAPRRVGEQREGAAADLDLGEQLARPRVERPDRPAAASSHVDGVAGLAGGRHDGRELAP